MKTTIVTATLLAAFGGVALAALAQQPAAPEGFVARLIERRLDITAAQREQARAVLLAERPTLAALHKQVEAERAEMDGAAGFDEARVRSIAAQYAETNAAVLVERAKVRAELLALLTPEQRQKLERMRAQFDGDVDARIETLGDRL